MIPQPTRVPAVVDALVTLLTEAFEDDGVAVIDGPPLDVRNLPADDVLVIGATGPDGLAVDNNLTKQQGLGPPRYLEVFEVFCIFSTVRGDTNMSDRRARCLWAMAKVQSVLEQSAGLGGVADQVTLGTAMSWGQEQHEDGATVDVMFPIAGAALL